MGSDESGIMTRLSLVKMVMADISAEDLLADREPGVPDFLVFSIVALIMGKSHEITTSCKAESDVVYMFCNLKVNVWHMIEAARFCRKKWLAIGAPEAVT